MNEPSAAWLGDGKRLHLQHGPIDLIIEGEGILSEVRLAYAQAVKRFKTVLIELVDELPRLRSYCPSAGLGLLGPVARRMEAAVLPLSSHQITPMAAVAGAVADEVLGALISERTLNRAYVNNGGDIALFLGRGHQYEVALAARPHRPALLGKVSLSAGDGIGGIATSGRHGRSHSLGIADSVTVLAANAASADAAATLIANAVDLPGHPAVERAPAEELTPDTDLGRRPVTIGVAPLRKNEVTEALDRGVTFAESLLEGQFIMAAALFLDDQRQIVGELSPPQPIFHQSMKSAKTFKIKKEQEPSYA